MSCESNGTSTNVASLKLRSRRDISADFAHITPLLQRLPKLRAMDLSLSGISGTLPQQVSSLVLEELRLRRTLVSGAIPPAFIKTLRVIDLSFSAVSGTLENLTEVDATGRVTCAART